MISLRNDLFARMVLSAKKLKPQHKKYVHPRHHKIISSHPEHVMPVKKLEETIREENPYDGYITLGQMHGGSEDKSSISKSKPVRSSKYKEEIAFIKIELHTLEKTLVSLKHKHSDKDKVLRIQNKIKELKNILALQHP